MRRVLSLVGMCALLAGGLVGLTASSAGALILKEGKMLVLETTYQPTFNIPGGVVDKTMPIHQSNVAIFNAATGKADRVGIKLADDGKKLRVFKSSGAEIKV